MRSTTLYSIGFWSLHVIDRPMEGGYYERGPLDAYSVIFSTDWMCSGCFEGIAILEFRLYTRRGQSQI